ncbi:hypothetical protein ES332_A01G139200v1 [Gossypium tomentosum]|uniref:Hexosyltransferase n=1 Tax=Gossypium tomentosum TaxID=34277 RepID=A0A5D2RTB1_GOSTO|nr:hypothetical protein ES332_A01G139200v1 [Gossypium tomentosum]
MRRNHLSYPNSLFFTFNINRLFRYRVNIVCIYIDSVLMMKVICTMAHLLHRLVIFTILITMAATVTPITHQHFKEASKFYNSPACLSISEPYILCSHQALHLAMTIDKAYIRGSMAAILSVLQHSSCPHNIAFHFLISATANASLLRATISSSFPYLYFRLYPFDHSSVPLISTSIRSALDCPLNYARIYLASLLPSCIHRVLYLDSDLILVDDVAELAAIQLGDNSVLAATEYCSANFVSYFTPTFWSNPCLSLTFANRKACYFNTGVMVMDLDRWREGDYTRKIEEWMEIQKRMRIYELGSLPPFLLVFAGNIVPVDHRWNQHGLGGDNFDGLCRDLHPGPVSVLHWSGKGKPWARLDAKTPCLLDALWASYDLMDTSFAFDS